MATIEAANGFIRGTYLPTSNARFSILPAGEGAVCTPIPGFDLDKMPLAAGGAAGRQ